MLDIDKLRDEIDDIDKQIIELFEKRMDVVLNVAKYKMERNLPIFNATRENSVIEKNLNRLKNKEYSDYAKDFLNNMMTTSRELQKSIMSSIKVGVQGVEGSFSEEAKINYFGEEKGIVFYDEFEDVFNALKNDEIEYGVLPVENSSTGAITVIYDLMKDYGFYILGEQCVKVKQNLIGLKGTKISDIKEVYSHPQGFAQSSEFLKKHKEWSKILYHNTALSVKHVCEIGDKSKVAIASERAAKRYGLEVIKENINNEVENTTKFIVIGKNLEYDKDSNRISIVFSLEDEAGTLYKLLRHFSENNINLKKIESRPISNLPWKYVLYIDFEGNLDVAEVKNAISLIEEKSRYFKLLGNYKSNE
ncbi:MAG: chorismate mutase [Clostridium sp.]|nr:chorismate mutase [Clostridium sp.]